MIANAHPLRGMRKDGVWVGLEAVFGGGTWVVDSANTDHPFFLTTVTDVGAGVHVFTFQASQAKRGMVFATLEEPADDPAAGTVGHDVKARALNLAAGTVRVVVTDFTAADPALKDPTDGARLRLWMLLETL